MNSKVAKKVRREVKKLEQKIASEFKDWTQSLGIKGRVILAFCIIFKRKW
jgi:mRNA-degrading endonuclease RelE of RelBE toxin-antitoxin system